MISALFCSVLFLLALAFGTVLRQHLPSDINLQSGLVQFIFDTTKSPHNIFSYIFFIIQKFFSGVDNMPIIVDNNMDEEIINALRRKFPQKKLIKSFPLTSISAPLNTHPDIQIHFLNSNTAVCAPECYDYYAAV